MHLIYVDESGDCGLLNSPSRYFILTGLVVHELRWHTYLNELIEFRRQMREKYGLRLREEFHAAAFINDPGDLVRIKRHDRLAMIRAFADTLASMTDINFINVVIDKHGKSKDYDVFDMAWKALIQRFENTISRHHFPGPSNSDERGIILSDDSDRKKITGLIRQLRRYNPIPSKTGFSTSYRNLPLLYTIEDPNFRDSAHSYFIQAADLAAFLLYQRLAPNTYMRKNSGQNYFQRLKPVLCLYASTKDPDGIVYL